MRSLDRETKRIIGADIKTVQFGWPLGMPLVRNSRAIFGRSVAHFGALRGDMLREETMKKHAGSRFDEFLAEEGILGEAEATAVKRVIVS